MFPSVCVNCFPMSRGELCLSLLFYGDYIFSTTFFPHSVLLYYKSSSHFKPFFFINILWNLVSLSNDILCYIILFYFSKLFNQLWFCYITLSSFLMESYPSDGVVSIFQTLHYCDKITPRFLKTKGTLTMFEEKFLRP